MVKNKYTIRQMSKDTGVTYNRLMYLLYPEKRQYIRVDTKWKRLTGYSIRDLSEQLGISTGQASKILRKVTDETRTYTYEYANSVLTRMINSQKKSEYVDENDTSTRMRLANDEDNQDACCAGQVHSDRS